MFKKISRKYIEAYMIKQIRKYFIDYIGIRINEPWYSGIINVYNFFYSFFHKEKYIIMERIILMKFCILPDSNMKVAVR